MWYSILLAYAKVSALVHDLLARVGISLTRHDVLLVLLPSLQQKQEM